MQASREWAPPGGTLAKILEETRRRLSQADPSTQPSARALQSGPGRPFLSHPSLRQALRRDAVAVIAEIKRRSPSKGELNDALDAAEQARAFERGGAAAISVLTEPTFFGGSVQDLVDVAAATRLPLLKKDFHIDRFQFLDAIRGQASAVLLIARALPPETLVELMQTAKTVRLDAVVEVRTEDELERALSAGASIIGVNSRDLETLEVDESVPQRLMPLIPPRVIGIWESGVHDVGGVERAADAGADAVLVGSTLSRSPDPEAVVRSLTRVRRRPRNG